MENDVITFDSSAENPRTTTQKGGKLTNYLYIVSLKKCQIKPKMILLVAYKTGFFGGVNFVSLAPSPPEWMKHVTVYLFFIFV